MRMNEGIVMLFNQTSKYIQNVIRVNISDLYMDGYCLKRFIYPMLNIVQINPIVMNYSNKYNNDSSTNASSAVEKKRRSRKTQPLSANDRTDLVFPRNREIFEVVNDKFHLRDLINEENKKHHIDLQTHSYCF